MIYINLTHIYNQSPEGEIPKKRKEKEKKKKKEKIEKKEKKGKKGSYRKLQVYVLGRKRKQNCDRQ